MLAHGIRPTASQRLLGLGVLIIMGLIALIPVRLVAASRAEKAERATVSAGGSGTYQIPPFLPGIAEVEAGEITIDAKELESARWFTRAECRLLLAGKHPEAFCPPPFAIAHQLLRSWVGEKGTREDQDDTSGPRY